MPRLALRRELADPLTVPAIRSPGVRLAGAGRPTWQNEGSRRSRFDSRPASYSDGDFMSKRGRKKKSRKKNNANHGNRPNA